MRQTASGFTPIECYPEYFSGTITRTAYSTYNASDYYTQIVLPGTGTVTVGDVRWSGCTPLYFADNQAVHGICNNDIRDIITRNSYHLLTSRACDGDEHSAAVYKHSIRCM